MGELTGNVCGGGHAELLNGVCVYGEEGDGGGGNMLCHRVLQYMLNC